MNARCECRTICQCAVVPGPAAWSIVRDGKEMKVCTRCILSGDYDRKLLVGKDDDANEFIEYDALGFFLMVTSLATEEGKDDNSQVS